MECDRSDRLRHHVPVQQQLPTRSAWQDLTAGCNPTRLSGGSSEAQLQGSLIFLRGVVLLYFVLAETSDVVAHLTVSGQSTLTRGKGDAAAGR